MKLVNLSKFLASKTFTEIKVYLHRILQKTQEWATDINPSTSERMVIFYHMNYYLKAHINNVLSVSEKSPKIDQHENSPLQSRQASTKGERWRQGKPTWATSAPPSLSANCYSCKEMGSLVWSCGNIISLRHIQFCFNPLTCAKKPDDQHLEEGRHVEGANADAKGCNKSLYYWRRQRRLLKDYGKTRLLYR